MFDIGKRYEERSAPYDLAFNAMVKTMATLANPRGWGLEPVWSLVPTELPDICRVVNTGGQVRVWKGENEGELWSTYHTVFGCNEHRQAFDAWAMATRYANGIGEGVLGAAQLACVMIHDTVKEYGTDDVIDHWSAMILAMTVGNANNLALFGEIPPDQRSFVLFKAETDYQRLGASISRHMADVKMTRRQAVAYAKKSGWS